MIQTCTCREPSYAGPCPMHDPAPVGELTVSHSEPTYDWRVTLLSLKNEPDFDGRGLM